MSGVAYAPVDRLVAVLGVVGALKFAERFGGGRVYLPQPERLKPEGAIVQTIGMEAARKLAFEWRGMEIMVPQCAAHLKRERDRAVHAEAKTLSVKEVALKYGITERHAFRILATAPEPEPDKPEAARAQGRLF